MVEMEFGGGVGSNKWLEELASESNTIQAQEDFTVSRKIAGKIKVKLYMILWWFFINFSGFINSFELSSCVVSDMARRTGFREQYYTGTRRFYCVKEDCRQNQGETIYDFVMVFHQFLRIDQFVWALVLCGIRYYQFASWESSGVIRKIHMRKIGRRQGRSTWWKFDTIHD